MIDESSYDLVQVAQEVDKICSYFLNPRKISYFQFNRIYKNNTFIILANNPNFFKEFPDNGFTESTIHVPIYSRQSSFCFWDETLTEPRLSYLREKQGLYHGLTILSRRKAFYDCTTFAMSKSHLSPVAYYFHILKELQKFSELFPTMARDLIKKVPRKLLHNLSGARSVNRKSFFLPKRSFRFCIGEDVNNYITTYEALCVQLAEEGKSYKEIGSILSIASTTVKTHLNRLRARTKLSLQEISMRSFQIHTPNKSIINLETDIKHENNKLSGTKKKKIS
ncbi:MAG: LuxR C-terminal-related transcriptional regulator [Alphaproteobacteria bacterium]|nr:LuxR C-terminal-related transcriptional regulator [Alphaproteobacteria bacterium]